MVDEKITPSLQNVMLSHSKTHQFKKGDIVIDIDEKMEGIPLVLDGLLKVHKEDDDDNEIFLYYLKPGDICSMGIKCCITGGKSLARVYAEESSEVLFISKTTIETLQDDHEWNNFVIQALASRIESLLDVADELAFKKLDERVLDYLEKKAQVQNAKTMSLTHKEISNDLNSSREVISRVLKKLENEERLILQRNEITLLQE